MRPVKKEPKKHYQEEHEERTRQVRLIRILASRLPWIVVSVIFITAIVTILQILWHKGQ